MRRGTGERRAGGLGPDDSGRLPASLPGYEVVLGVSPFKNNRHQPWNLP